MYDLIRLFSRPSVLVAILGEGSCCVELIKYSSRTSSRTDIGSIPL